MGFEAAYFHFSLPVAASNAVSQPRAWVHGSNFMSPPKYVPAVCSFSASGRLSPTFILAHQSVLGTNSVRSLGLVGRAIPFMSAENGGTDIGFRRRQRLVGIIVNGTA